jgi:hypothetical protein
MQGTALPAPAGTTGTGDDESVVVHVQLRPRRGSARKCLAALAALAAEHETVPFTVTGLSKDDRVVRVTVGIDLGPRSGVAKFSPQAQAAYAFVSALFTALYDHMPVYTAEPSEAERAAAATLLEVASGGRAAAERADLDSVAAGLTGAGTPPVELPAPRAAAGWGSRVPA